MQHIRKDKSVPLISLVPEPWDYLGSKRQKMLEESWPGLFRKYLLKELPVKKIAEHFHVSMGRPSIELYTALGLLVLQQLLDLSDAELVSAFAFDIRLHYALDLPGEGEKGHTICERSLREYRRIVIEQHLEECLFETLTDKLMKACEVNIQNQRLDSTHIFSNMRRLGRIAIFSHTIKKFLVNLKRQYRDIFDKEIPLEMASRYLTKEGKGCFSQIKPSETKNTLKTASEDLFSLVTMFQDNEDISRLNSFHLLSRVLEEQCIVSKQEDGNKRVEVKPSKDVASDSLQNPSDPDATYDGHKGQGYQVQIMETFVADDKKDKTKPNLITYVKVEVAHKSDTEALIPAIEDTVKRNCAPKKIEADTHYGSDENIQAAEKLGVKVNAPVMGKAKSKMGLDRFSFQEDGEGIKSCPMGSEPEKNWKTKTEQNVALFSLEGCQGCKCREECPVKEGKRGNYLYYSAKQIRLDKRRAYEDSEEFLGKYRWRAGIEGTNSHLKSDTGAGRLRVRGLVAVTYCVTLKVLGLNILRASAALSAKLKASKSVKVVNNCLNREFLWRILSFLTIKSYLKLLLRSVVCQRTFALKW